MREPSLQLAKNFKLGVLLTMPVTPALWKLRQEKCSKLNTSLDYIGELSRLA